MFSVQLAVATPVLGATKEWAIIAIPYFGNSMCGLAAKIVNAQKMRPKIIKRHHTQGYRGSL
jgi:hypothetical protein